MWHAGSAPVPIGPRQRMPDAAPIGDPLLQSGVEALYALAAAILLAGDDRLTADQAARRVAQLRHEVRHALRDWAPPPDSYRARDLPPEP
jgi:hypothetical protein